MENMNQARERTLAFPTLRTLNRAIVSLVFFGLLALPVIWFGRASFAPTELHENRRLEAFPGYSLFFLRDFEHWFSDRYGMRDALVYYGSRLQLAKTGSPMNQNVVIGRDNWLFFDEYYVPGQPHFADMYGKAPFSEQDLQVIGANLTSIRRSLNACGIPFYFVMAPDKKTIYPEKLDPAAPANVVTAADQLIAHLRAADPELRVIDLRQPVKDARATQTFDLFKRTDTHWNTLGAFFGYRTIAQRLVADRVLSAAPNAELSAYRISRKPFKGGDIAVNLLDLPDYFEDYVVSFESIAAREAHPVQLPGWPINAGDTFVATENDAAHGDLLLYRDSFAGELMPFFADDFHRMYSFLGRRVDGVAVQRAKPKVVIFEIVERNIRHLNESPLNLEQSCKR